MKPRKKANNTPCSAALQAIMDTDMEPGGNNDRVWKAVLERVETRLGIGSDEMADGADTDEKEYEAMYRPLMSHPEWVHNRCSWVLYRCDIHSNWDFAAEFRSNYASELREAGLVDIAQAFAVIERLRPVYKVLHGCDATMGWLSMEEREAAAGVEFTEEEMEKLSNEDQRRIDEEDYPVDYQRLLEEAKRANLLLPPEGGAADPEALSRHASLRPKYERILQSMRNCFDEVENHRIRDEPPRAPMVSAEDLASREIQAKLRAEIEFQMSRAKVDAIVALGGYASQPGDYTSDDVFQRVLWQYVMKHQSDILPEGK